MKRLIAIVLLLLVAPAAGCIGGQQQPADDEGASATPERQPAQEIEQRAVPDTPAASVNGLKVNLQQSRQKTSTGKTFSEIAAEGLSKTADVALSAGQIAAPSDHDASVSLQSSAGN